MILKISSRFPRLNYCNAFQASLLSDFPEEQEWLIGHMYIRVLDVITVPSWMPVDLNPNGLGLDWSECLDAMPMVSIIKQYFFVLQLFKEQIFTMDEWLALDLAVCLAVNRKECCVNKEKYARKYEPINIDFPVEDWNLSLIESHFEMA